MIQVIFSIILGIILISYYLTPEPRLDTEEPEPRHDRDDHDGSRPSLGKVPISVNYHFTRRCNKTCGFCFHTATSSHIEPPHRQKQALQLLAKAGMRKINFAGGEPFLYPKPLGEMITFCKRVLKLESVSIVTNGSLVREAFLQEHADELDILAVNCDSFDEQTNIRIGRGSGDQVKKLYEIAGITDEQFDAFIKRHEGQKCLVPEPNRLMAKSYLILDEYLRFLDRTGKQPSKSVLEVGVEEALQSVFWDEDAFLEKGGLYDWVKPEGEGGCAGGVEGVDW